MLRRRDFVVLRAREHADFPQFFVQIAHEIRHAGFQRAIELIVHLLSLRRTRAEERSAGESKVGALQEHLLIDQEILLFRARGREYARNAYIAEELQDALRLNIDRLHGAQKRRFFIEHLTGKGAVRRRDAERAILDESVRSRIPCGIATGFKRRAQAAGRE